MTRTDTHTRTARTIHLTIPAGAPEHEAQAYEDLVTDVKLGFGQRSSWDPDVTVTDEPEQLPPWPDGKW